MIEVLIDGQPVLVQGGSMDIQKNITDFDTLTFNVITYEDRTWFSEGMIVELYFQNILKFSGKVLQVREQGAMNNYLVHQIGVQGNEYLLDNVTIAKAYQYEYSGDIIGYLSNDYFIAEGIQPGVIHKGLSLHDVKFGYISGLTAVKRMAEISNYAFKVDENKKLHFRSKDDYPAPFPLEWVYTLSGSVRVKKGNHQYRNTQYSVGGKALTDTLTEEFKGDGNNKNFTLRWPTGVRPKAFVSINGGPFEEKLVGFKDITESGYFFYFKMEDNVIVQDSTAPTLTSVDIVRFEYQGLYDVVVVNKIQYEIDNRKVLDGSTGVVSKVIERNLKGMENINQVNMQILNKYGTQDGFIVEYETEEEGLEPGMLQPVHLPEHNLIDTEGLITHVKIRDIDDRLRYSIRVVNGPFDEDWTAFFSKRDINEGYDLIEGSDFIQPVYSYEKVWAETEHPNLFAQSIYPSSTTYPSSTLYPSLPTDKKIKYLAYYINDIETGRVPIISQSEVEGAIFSRAILGLDVEGTISKLAWIGGAEAINEVGTGIYLDIQTTNLIKTNLETFQIEKADRKGW